MTPYAAWVWVLAAATLALLLAVMPEAARNTARCTPKSLTCVAGEAPPASTE